VVTAVALASVLALVATPEEPAWQAWLDNRWTKTVRRGTGPQLAAAEPFAAAQVEVGGARAYGFVPCTYDELPAPLVKMQVAFFERDREGDLDDPGRGPVICVNPAVEMSTGKTAAQAAHGIFRWWVARSDQARAAWLASGHPVWVRTALSPAGWSEALRTAEGTVNDAGLTEISRGALTIAVRDRPA
jgi:peptidyl-tRNA hydrolase